MITTTDNSITTVRYLVRIITGEHFPPEDWSMYYIRCRQKSKGQNIIIYGEDQARAHIEEIKQRSINGRLIYFYSKFQIVRITEVKTIIEV